MPPTPTRPDPPRASSARWARLAIAAGVLVSGVFGYLWLQERGTEPDEVTSFLSENDEAVARTATEVLTAIASYSPETVDDQARAITGLATGQFLEDYEALLAGGLGEVVTEAGATSRGRIATGPDVAFTSAERATAVARIVQEITTAGDERTRTVFSVMRLGLVEVGGRWKADGLEVLSQNSL